MASTKEKLIAHVSTEAPVGNTNKVTVVGVGMVGMAAAISILLKVRETALCFSTYEYSVSSVCNCIQLSSKVYIPTDCWKKR